MLRDATSRSIDLGSAPWTVSWGPHVCSALGLSFLMLSHCAKRPSVRLDCECAATTPCSCECCGASPAIRLGRRTEQRRTRPVPLPRATPAEPKKIYSPRWQYCHRPTSTHAADTARRPPAPCRPAPQPKLGSSAVPRAVGNAVTAWPANTHRAPSPLRTPPCTLSDSASPPSDPRPSNNKPSRSDHDSPGPTSLVQLRLAPGDGSAVGDPRPERGDVPGSRSCRSRYAWSSKQRAGGQTCIQEQHPRELLASGSAPPDARTDARPAAAKAAAAAAPPPPPKPHPLPTYRPTTTPSLQTTNQTGSQTPIGTRWAPRRRRADALPADMGGTADITG